MQAELVNLEDELQKLATRDASHPNRDLYTNDWWFLNHGQCDEDREQWNKVVEIREKLEKYSMFEPEIVGPRACQFPCEKSVLTGFSDDALLKDSHLTQLGTPTKHNVRILREWFERRSMGEFPLVGKDENSWSEEKEWDLVALHPRQNPDFFASWFGDSLVPWFLQTIPESFAEKFEVKLIYHLTQSFSKSNGTHLKKKPSSRGAGEGIYQFQDSKATTFAEVLTTVVASLLPICSVVILYLAPSDAVRLGMLVIFSACFALALTLMTKARKIEVFAATSAYDSCPHAPQHRNTCVLIAS
jgi:hypothetical protein